ncbi:MAG: peptide chain release factor N(5)-glutamine methyltransferase [Alistipes finegoldii]
MTTRRDILGRISARLAPLYGAREARSIALVAVSELSGLSASALLTDPGAPLEIAELDDILGTEIWPQARPVPLCRGTHGVLRPHVRRARRGADSPARNRRAAVARMVRAEPKRRPPPFSMWAPEAAYARPPLALALPKRAGICGGHLRHGARKPLPATAGRSAPGSSAQGRRPERSGRSLSGTVRRHRLQPALRAAERPARDARQCAGIRAARSVIRPRRRPAALLPRHRPRRTADAPRPAAGSTSKFTNASPTPCAACSAKRDYTVDTEVREDLNGKPRMTCSRLK